MTTVFGSNPYCSFKEITPEWTLCEVCDRKLKSKDWSSHRNSKKHRENSKSHDDLPKTSLRSGEREGILKTTTVHVDSFEADSLGKGSPPSGTFTTYTVNISATSIIKPTKLENFVAFISNSLRLRRQKTREVNTIKRVTSSYHIDSADPQSVTINEIYLCLHREADLAIDTLGNNSSDMDRNCYKCGMSGHISRDCTQGGASGACYNCGLEGHMSKDCTEPRKGGSGSRGCFSCGMDGHMSRDCPNKSANGSGKGCFNCGGEGHMSRDCANPKNPNARRPDYSKMKCHNCGECQHNCLCNLGSEVATNDSLVGHGSKRCQKPLADSAVDSGFDNFKSNDGGDSGWDAAADNNNAGNSSWNAEQDSNNQSNAQW